MQTLTCETKKERKRIYLRTLIIASTLLLPTIIVGDELSESAAQLAKQFCSAHTAGDYPAIEKLIYWQGVEKKMKKQPI